MQPLYLSETEQAMRHLYHSLSERERRLYAATESVKLGRGGVSYLSRLFGRDEKTIRRGRREIGETSQLPRGRSRKKGAVEKHP